MPVSAKIILTSQQPCIIGENKPIEGVVKLESDDYYVCSEFSIKFIGRIKTRQWANFGSVNNPDMMTLSDAGYVEITTQRLRYLEFIEKGTSDYFFDFFIHDDCISSMEGKHGHIRYEIILHIDTLRLGETIAVMPVSVLRKHSLMDNPVFRMPLEIKLEGNHLMFLKQCKLRYSLKTPYRAYAPGETIRYTLEAHEKSSIEVQSYRIKFLKVTTYIYDLPSRSGQYSYATLYSTEVMDNGEENQIIIRDIVIPSTSPSFCSKIIYVNYLIEAEVILSMGAPKYTIRLPILIGTDTIKPNEDEGCATQPVFEAAGEFEDPFVDYDLESQYRHVGFSPLYPVYRK